MNDREIGAMQAQIETLTGEVHELRNDVKSLNARLSAGAGGARVLMWVGGVVLTLMAAAAWFGQHFRPYG